MERRWIVKSEPSAYSFADLERDGRTIWDGIRNAQALIHVRTMRKGDRVLFYHSGEGRELVGLARVGSNPYADPAAGDPKLAVVDLVPLRALPKPVPLAAVKADPALADLGLVRHSRLSVMPVSPAQWSRLLALAGEP